MKLILCLLIMVFVNINIAYSQKIETDKKFDFNCSTCHNCEKPTKKNPCLKSCPRAELITIHHSPEEGPGQLIMNDFLDLSDMYEPVLFSHRVHAEMSGMAGGCAMCHHNNPPGKILPCRDCHEKQRLRSNIEKPDLMGAYHQQCFDCHREWSHSTSCTSCHALKSSKAQPAPTADLPKPGSKVHPEIIEPTVIEYETDCDEGKIVTFYHNDHTKRFGFGCSTCHQSESCINCHDKTKTAQTEVSHDRCSNCHDTDDNCGFCHSEKKKPPFNHFTRSKFAIDGFHKNIKCITCHGKNFKRLKLDKECNSCHESWNSENFNHRITGFILDENHIDNDCEDCHLRRKFNQNPDCKSCHEDEYSYPRNKPGKKIGHKK